MAVTIVGLAFLVVGAPFVLLARRIFARDRAISRWPRAEGIVTSATLMPSTERITDQNTGLDSYRTYYKPSIRYTYTVAGQTFEGKSIARSHDGHTTTLDAAKRITDKYGAGTQVQVYYDPRDSKIGYLELRRPTGAILILALGLFWIALGTLILTLSFT